MFLFNIETSRLISHGTRRHPSLAGASLLAKNSQTPRATRSTALSLTIFASKLAPTGWCIPSPNASHSTAIPGRARTPPRCSSR
ncbi:hypothetical protein EUX53_06650 [Pseudomonas orientalis]|nr:hypothetical protein EUX53_06650 [Pseudomonas orientalis]